MTPDQTILQMIIEGLTLQQLQRLIIDPAQPSELRKQALKAFVNYKKKIKLFAALKANPVDVKTQMGL